MSAARLRLTGLLAGLLVAGALVTIAGAVGGTGVDLAQRYPTTLEGRDYDPDHAREWTFAPEDIFELTKFDLIIGKDLTIACGAADLGIGHCADGAVWAIVIPRTDGHVTSSAGANERLDHIWLRFHPREIGKLFPPETVREPGDQALLGRMQRIARFKLPGSYHVGLRVMIPERKDMTVDADTADQRRRLFVVDREAGQERYNSGAAGRALPPLKPLDPQTAEKSFDQLWESYDRDYAMFTLRPELDWRTLRDQYRPKALACKTSLDFAQVCAELLRPLRDLHIWVSVDGEPVEVFNRPRTLNANPAAREALIGKIEKMSRELCWGRTQDDVGYVAIDGWSNDRTPDQFDRVLEKLNDTRGLIIDVRINGGGSEPLAEQVAGRFADRPVTYAFSQFRNGPAHANLTPKQPRTLVPRGPWRYRQPVVVLMGQKCMSSNESFVAMMAECPQVTTMGDRTCGSSGNPKMLKLPAGVVVSLPQWIDLLPDGTPLDERGVQPKVRFEGGADAFKGERDDLLSAALERLRKQPLPAPTTAPAAPSTPIAVPADVSDVAGLWEQVRGANRAWLDPPVSNLTVRADLKERTDIPPGERGRWERRMDAKTLAAHGRNAVFLQRIFGGAGELITRELRYADGVGGEVKRMPVPPTERNRRMMNSEWLAARIGVRLWTSLHTVAVSSLPAGTVAEQRDGLIVMRLAAPAEGTSPQQATAWQQIMATFDYPSYGLLATDGVGANGVVGLKAVEWELDATTLRPKRLLEHGVGEAVVTFGDDWLAASAGPCPRQITASVELNKDNRTEIAYEMQCVEGAWVIKQANVHVWVRGEEIDSLARRLEPNEISLKPIAPEEFQIPADVELPEHSYTELKPGERVVSFKTTDGLTLEGKLSLPPDAKGPVPVVMYLPGSGPWTFDRPLRIPKPGQMFESVQLDYLDLYSSELIARGMGFFRVNKRGCAQIKEPPYMLVRRAIFGKITPVVLLDDYAAALAALRSEAGVDKDRVVLLGTSEGTALAPRLAKRAPTGVVGLVLAGLAEDNTHDTIVWQNTVGPWRNMARVYDLDNDDRITPAEFASGKPDCLFKLHLGNARFEDMDADKNGVLEPRDLAALNEPRLKVILKAVEERDDEWLWWNLLMLNSAHLRAEWDRPPLHQELLDLQIPIHIVHGTHDGTVRIEGARAAEAAFRAAGRSNLTLHVIERGDHDLQYGEYLDSYFAGKPKTPPAMQVMFNAAAELARAKP